MCDYPCSGTRLLTPWAAGEKPCCCFVSAACANSPFRHTGTALTDSNQTVQGSDPRMMPVTSLYAYCLHESFLCLCLELTEALSCILRVFYFVDIGITTTASSALDVAALCLSSWPAAIFTQTVYFTQSATSSTHFQTSSTSISSTSMPAVSLKLIQNLKVLSYNLCQFPFY